ncbi:MAG: efflux RND transporter periplasmic adaptor subunit, partial [Planctomycetales bacterium]|nr:efflux RND transporter periplasmic adaptor subunit [Planctomycetales bacterium]
MTRLPHRRLAATLFALLAAASMTAPLAAERIEVRAAIVQLIDRNELAAEDSGLLAELTVAVGDRVQQGDSLAVLNDAEAKLLMNQAKAELAHAELEAASTLEIQRAEQALKFRESEWNRADLTAKRNPGSFSLSELDKKLLDFNDAKIELELAREQQRLRAAKVEIHKNSALRAQQQWDRRRIRSPLAGVVERINKRQGEWVEAGEPLALVVNAGRLRVQGLIDVSDYDPRLEGAKATIQIEPLRDRVIDGVVSFVSTENEPRTKDIRIWIDFENPDNLVRPGM